MTCQAKTKLNKTCKVKTNNNYCHIHKNKQSVAYQDNCKLVKQIEKIILEDERNHKIFNNQSEQLKNTIKKNEQLKQEVKHLNKSLEKKNIIINSQTIKMNELIIQNKRYVNDLICMLNQIKDMKIDYNNYQIIKQFERLKNQLLKQKIDIYNYDNDKYHQLRLKRNLIVHESILVD